MAEPALDAADAAPEPVARDPASGALRPAGRPRSPRRSRRARARRAGRGSSDRDADVLTGLAEPLALAIDNGLWFDRLRMLGAEGERDRLARDLHDRFAQGLAYVNLELDRLSRHPEPGPHLVELRQQVRGLLGDVRETLRQLRSRVTPTAGLADLLDRRAAPLRRADRHHRPRSTPSAGAPRLPVAVEQELWRISQEALGNVERHAKATALDVTWTCDGRHGRLVIADDGAGFDPGGVDHRRPQHVGHDRHAGAGQRHRRPPDRRLPARRRHVDLSRGHRTGNVGGVTPGPRLLLVDDHKLLRQGLRRAVEEAGFDVVGEAGDGEEAVRLAVALQPDLVLMDVTDARPRRHRGHPPPAPLGVPRPGS